MFLERLLAKSSVTWDMAGFDLVFAAMPLMCFLSGRLQNRACACEANHLRGRPAGRLGGLLPSKPHKGYRSGYRSGYVQGIVLGPHRIHIFELRTAHASRGPCFTSPAPGGLHLQKAAKTNRSTRV